ncbi:MAG: D-alanyl-D-alanine carboxypeptidase/D-alanyl-D-alanine-endopeptidase [Sphingomonadales bacterium]|nr:D-alanyl-D-alanine carboxypeptidase/D-alanyl-D-alanine-endopeptidase [Sphingomonadales bacterium]
MLATPALGEPSQALRQQVEAILASAPAGTRFGLLVEDDNGNEVIAVNADERFIPASNTKLFTTAAALEVMGRDPAAANAQGTTTLMLAPGKRGMPDVVLTGGGAALSTAPDCVQRCLNGSLTTIADKAHRVGNVVADDTAFADQRWSPGASWNNIGTDSGTAVSAVIVDDNVLPLVVVPGMPGQPAVVTVSPYFALRNETLTVSKGETRLALERPVNGRELRIYGTILRDAPAWHETLGIDDPAEYAGWLVRQGLVARGVQVTGKVVVRHRPPRPPDPRNSSPFPPPASFAISFIPAPLGEEVAAINKPSQNLHAEALLRRLGKTAGQDISQQIPAPEGSLEAGLTVLRGVLAKAGIVRTGYDFSDGSGMSTYNRVSPRAAVELLRWGKAQDWGATWRASFPIAGVDGTLHRRFIGTPLQGKLGAKTGTLNASNALSGYLQAASGRELVFSFFANDVPDGANAVPIMDAVLLAIAAAN